MRESGNLRIAVASGKGGTGKTTVAVNLAAYLAADVSTVLVDLDVEEPNLGLFTGENEIEATEVFRQVPDWREDSCTACGLCQKVCNFNAVLQLGSRIMIFPELCHGCYACSEMCPQQALPMRDEPIGFITQRSTGALQLFEGRLNITQEQAVPLIGKTIEHAQARAGSAVLMLRDCPPGTSCPVTESVKGADFVLLVTEPTPFGMHDLQLAAELMKSLELPFYVIINRDGAGDSRVENWCREEDIEIVGRIPDSRAAAEAYSRGELLIDAVPEISAAVGQIAAWIKLKAEERRA